MEALRDGICQGETRWKVQRTKSTGFALCQKVDALIGLNISEVATKVSFGARKGEWNNGTASGRFTMAAENG